MAAEAFLLLANFLAVLLLLAQQLGRLMTGLMLDVRYRCRRALGGLSGLYVIGAAMHWRHYLCAILLFNLLGSTLLLAILLLQRLRPITIHSICPAYPGI